MAAETPQMETADAKITPNSSSTFNKRESHNEKNHTADTTTTACNMPGKPACMMSVNRILVPKITSPVLIKNSDRAASFSHSGIEVRLPINKPEKSANTTYSIP